MKLKKVHEDIRGAIYIVEGALPADKEFAFLEIKKGYARGGCYHDVDENWIVIKGNVRVLTMNITDEQPHLHCYNAIAGTSGVFKARTAHAFIADEDSIVIEFGVSTSEKEENKKYAPLFEYVKITNEK